MPPRHVIEAQIRFWIERCNSDDHDKMLHLLTCPRCGFLPGVVMVCTN